MGFYYNYILQSEVEANFFKNTLIDGDFNKAQASVNAALDELVRNKEQYLYKNLITVYELNAGKTAQEVAD